MKILPVKKLVAIFTAVSLAFLQAVPAGVAMLAPVNNTNSGTSVSTTPVTDATGTTSPTSTNTPATTTQPPTTTQTLMGGSPLAPVSAAPVPSPLSSSFNISASTNAGGASNLSIVVNSGKATVGYNGSTLTGSFVSGKVSGTYLTVLSLPVSGSMTSRVLSLNFTQDASGSLKLTDLSDKTTYSFTSGITTNSTTCAFMENPLGGAMVQTVTYEYSGPNSYSRNTTSYTYLTIPGTATSAAKVVVASAVSDNISNYNQGMISFSRSKAYYRYDAAGSQTGSLYVSSNTYSGQTSYYASYQVKEPANNQTIYVSENDVDLVSRINQFSDYTLVDQNAAVRTVSYYTDSTLTQRKFDVEEVSQRNSLGGVSFVPAKVTMPDGKTYMVRGTPDVLPRLSVTDPADIFLKNGQTVNGYSISYGQGYSYEGGKSTVIGYGLVFSKWDSATSKQITVVVTYPAQEQEAVTLEGLSYLIKRDAAGVITLKSTLPPLPVVLNGPVMAPPPPRYDGPTQTPAQLAKAACDSNPVQTQCVYNADTTLLEEMYILGGGNLRLEAKYFNAAGAITGTRQFVYSTVTPGALETAYFFWADQSLQKVVSYNAAGGESGTRTAGAKVQGANSNAFNQYDQNNKLIATFWYSGGILANRQIFYVSGNISYQDVMSDGNVTGRVDYFDTTEKQQYNTYSATNPPDQRRRAEVWKSGGVPYLAISYYSNGNRKDQDKFSAGKLTEHLEWYEAGGQKVMETYVNGYLSKREENYPPLTAGAAIGHLKVQDVYTPLDSQNLTGARYLQYHVTCLNKYRPGTTDTMKEFYDTYALDGGNRYLQQHIIYNSMNGDWGTITYYYPSARIKSLTTYNYDTGTRTGVTVSYNDSPNYALSEAVVAYFKAANYTVTVVPNSTTSPTSAMVTISNPNALAGGLRELKYTYQTTATGLGDDAKFQITSAGFKDKPMDASLLPLLVEMLKQVQPADIPSPITASLTNLGGGYTLLEKALKLMGQIELFLVLKNMNDFSDFVEVKLGSVYYAAQQYKYETATFSRIDSVFPVIPPGSAVGIRPPRLAYFYGATKEKYEGLGFNVSRLSTSGTPAPYSFTLTPKTTPATGKISSLTITYSASASSLDYLDVSSVRVSGSFQGVSGVSSNDIQIMYEALPHIPLGNAHYTIGDPKTEDMYLGLEALLGGAKCTGMESGKVRFTNESRYTETFLAHRDPVFGIEIEVMHEVVKTQAVGTSGIRIEKERTTWDPSWGESEYRYYAVTVDASGTELNRYIIQGSVAFSFGGKDWTAGVDSSGIVTLTEGYPVLARVPVGTSAIRIEKVGSAAPFSYFAVSTDENGTVVQRIQLTPGTSYTTVTLNGATWKAQIDPTGLASLKPRVTDRIVNGKCEMTFTSVPGVSYGVWTSVDNVTWTRVLVSGQPLVIIGAADSLWTSWTDPVPISSTLFKNYDIRVIEN